MLRSFYTLLFLMAGTTTAFSQAYFEGEVTYRLTYSNVSAELKDMMDMFPTSLTLKIKGQQSRTEQDLPNVGKKITVEDSDFGTAFILIEALDQRLATNVPKNVMEEANQGNSPGIQKLKGETKEILGYTCKKVKVFANEGQESEVYYTERIPASAYADFKFLDGFPLMYVMRDSDFTLTATAVEVKEKNLSDDLFYLNDSYQNISYQEFIDLDFPGY